MIKMIATDLDGTLLRDDKSISQYTKVVLQQCRKQGIKIAVATARPYHSGTFGLLEGITLDGMVATNGAFVYAGDKLIREHALPAKISRTLLLALGNNPGVLSISARKRDLCYRSSRPQHESDIVYDFTQPFNDTIAHMAFRTEDSAFAESLIAQYPQLEIYRVSGEHLYDIGSEGCTKAAGLAVLAKHFGIAPSEIVAFGDDHNDIDMLCFAGTGVAMANAIDEVKVAADCTCGSNEEDGLAKWLEEHILSMSIKAVTAQHLPEYAEIIRQSFATVAQDFGITRENWPGHTAFITDKRLRSKIGPGYHAFGCFADEKIIGFASLEHQSGGVFEMCNMAVLPEYRNLKIGKALLDFCKEQLTQLGGYKIEISIIEDNTRLKNWYAANGFVHTGTKQFDGVPFLVGYMEWLASK